ncbi:MAG: hypothetical protein PF904_10225 [Kiritimatiellae bacterium]|jgi:hypothetical protein|nr:hypothetical protein [Kiritimatiellia bacterium]
MALAMLKLSIVKKAYSAQQKTSKKNKEAIEIIKIGEIGAKNEQLNFRILA